MRIKLNTIDPEQYIHGWRLSDLPNGTLVNFEMGFRAESKPEYMKLDLPSFFKIQDSKIALLDIESWELDSINDTQVYNSWTPSNINIDMVRDK